ncbi:MAG: PspA-associated protein PspAB [Dehalococcoidia bacterium]
MGLLDTLFGRSKPVKSKSEKLFAMSTASVTLQVKLDLQPAGASGIVFRPVDSSYFRQAEQELSQLLELSGKETKTKVRTETDSFGFRWVILQDPVFEDLVATIHMVSITLTDKGFGDQLLAAVFRFDQASSGKRAVYWVYNYKRGSFYPFVPQTGQERRDNSAELHFASVMEGELPVEKAPEQWYALWGIPF